MYMTKSSIHIASKHFWKPVIDAGKHSKEWCHTHYQMKMRYNKTGIMYMQDNIAIRQAAIIALLFNLLMVVVAIIAIMKTVPKAKEK